MPVPDESSDNTSPLSETIRESAQSAKDVTVDGTTTRDHSLREQIEADKYLAGLKARKKRGLPLRIHRIKPGGTA